MSNKVKEGCWVGILTILHAIFTVLELGKMPIVIFRHMQATGGMAFVLWTVYGVALYFVVLVYEKGQEVMIKDFFGAVCFGGSMAVVKGIIDTVGEMICKIDYRYIPIEILTETLLFGVILFFVLHFKVANKKIVFDLKKISAPIVGIAIVLVMYIIQACNKLGNYIEYQHYATTEVELNNLDTYVAHTILFHNVWVYVVLYILLWWFMQRITVAKEIKDVYVREKIKREDLITIMFLFTWGIFWMFCAGSEVSTMFPVNPFGMYWKTFWFWFSFGFGVYIGMQLAVAPKKTLGKLLMGSLLCGSIVYVGKAILDMILLVIEVRVEGIPWVWSVVREVIMILYAILIMRVVYNRTFKIRVDISVKRVEKPVVVMLIAAFLYVSWYMWCLLQIDWDYRMLLVDYNPSEYEAAMMIDKIGIPICVLFSIAFWKMLRKVGDEACQEQ